MVRSMWKRSFVAALLCGGVAWGQPPATGVAGKVLIFHEPGKPAQRCLVLQSWRMPNGEVRLQVQNLQTGEVVVIAQVEATPVAAPASVTVLRTVPGPHGPPRPAPAPAAGGHWVTTSELAAGLPYQNEVPESSGMFAGVRKLFGKGPVAEVPAVVADATPAAPPVVAPLAPAAPPTAPYLANAFVPRAEPAKTPAPAAPVGGRMASPPVALRPAPASAPATGRREVMAVLRDSPYPSQREVAVETLAAADWRADPNVVPVLTQAAREDPAATVRAACVRCLVRMGANTGPVLETLRKLQTDPDVRVRREAERALGTFATGGLSRRS